MSFLDKLAKIDALIQLSSSEEERQAAQLAKERVLAKTSLDESYKPNAMCEFVRKKIAHISR